jgi:L-lactate dehydrogenase complex protein LldG
MAEAAAPDPPAVDVPGTAPPPATAVFQPTLETFTDRAAPLGIAVGHAADPEAGASWIAAVVGDWGATEAVVAAELMAAAPTLLRRLTETGVRCLPPADPASIRDAPLGLSLARAAVAETASVLLAEPSLANRAIGMLARGQIVVCRSATLVADLDGVVPHLRDHARQGPAYATLVTGPSRTADIERVLTVGVQGPARLAILFVDDLR